MVDINKAQYIQLVNYATSVGIDIPVATSREDAIEMILDAFPDTTEIPENALDASQAKPENVTVKGGGSIDSQATDELHYSNDPKVTIKISPSQTDKHPVFVGVNGVGFTINRGVNVIVPYRVFEAMQQAVEFKYDFVDRGPGMKPEMVESEVQSYNYTVIDMPPRDEVRMWRERTAASFMP